MAFHDSWRRYLKSAIAAAFAIAGVLWLTTRRFAVEGRSMSPTYVPGDRVAVNALVYLAREPRIGDVVVLRRAASNGRIDIKRIAGRPGEEVLVAGEPRILAAGEWYVVGDNAAESVDSRIAGPVRRGEILGPVLFKY